MHPRLRIIALVAPALAAAMSVGAGGCWNFDATMGGGPLADGGSSGGFDGTFADAHVGDADGASPIADAGGDGASDSGSDAAPVVHDGGFCASLTAAGLVLCDDFDEPGTLPGPFNTEFETWGTLGETDASFKSPSESLDEKTFVLNDGGVINVALRNNTVPVPTLPATLTFAFSLDAVQIDTTTGDAIVLGAVDFFDAAGDRYTLGLAINTANALPALALDEQSALTDGGAPYIPHTLPPTDAPAIGAWSDIVITIDWTAAQTGTASVSVNGTTEVGPFPLTMTVANPTSLQVGIGTSFVTQPAPAWELLYDNVWFAEH
jgi:hypothetical protein